MESMSKVKTSNFTKRYVRERGLRIWIKINSTNRYFSIYLSFFSYETMINRIFGQILRTEFSNQKKNDMYWSMKDGEVIAIRSSFLLHRKWIERRKEKRSGGFRVVFFFFFFQGHVQTFSYQLKVSICKPMARNLHRTSTGIIYEKSLEIH